MSFRVPVMLLWIPHLLVWDPWPSPGLLCLWMPYILNHAHSQGQILSEPPTHLFVFFKYGYLLEFTMSKQSVRPQDVCNILRVYKQVGMILWLWKYCFSLRKKKEEKRGEKKRGEGKGYLTFSHEQSLNLRCTLMGWSKDSWKRQRWLGL